MKNQKRMIVVDFSLEIETLDKIDTLCEKTSRSAWLRTAVNHYLETMAGV